MIENRADPEAGGTIVVANHPHGILAGLALASLLLAIRKDVRFLANGMLQDIHGVGELVIPVNPNRFRDQEAPGCFVETFEAFKIFSCC